MQILVVVANIQVRTLKAEVEKGSMGTAVDHGSGGPKRSGDSVQRRGVPTVCLLLLLLAAVAVGVLVFAAPRSERESG